MIRKAHMSTERQAPNQLHHDGVDATIESDDYLAKRTLRSGSAGWVLLAGLGVSYVISGDYAGWNNGLAQGGWGGLAIAAVIIAGMYLAMVLGMAEMSSALPAAGGGYTFARRAMGPWGGYATGIAILIEYSIAPAAIATFIGAYVQSLNLFGITDGWWVYLFVYALFIGIHLTGAGEALKAMFVITAIALVGLVIFAVFAIGKFDAHNLTDIAVTDAAGASGWLPYGYLGIWAAVPFAIWFFLAIEGVPLAAEEAREPEKNVPRGIIVAMLILVVTGATVFPPRPRRRRRERHGGVGQPARGGARRRHRRQGRQLHRPRRAGRELLLHHVRLLAADLRALARRLPPQEPLGHQRA